MWNGGICQANYLLVNTTFILLTLIFQRKKELLYAVLMLKNVEDCVSDLFISFRKANPISSNLFLP